MRSQRHGPFFLFAVLLTGLLLSGHVRSDTSQKESEKALTSEAIVIASKSLEIDDDLKLITFTGDVNAKSDDFVIDCQKLVVYYENAPARNETGEVKTRFDKIIATGQLTIKRIQGGVATAEKAIYYQQDEKVVLTGNPVVRQDNDFVEGNRITIFIKENRSVVESSEDSRVKAFIFPKNEER
ncbi:MAG: lipopolysaccharide transport periplasmic protein LptA [Thermodesulfobacteriota bacterium]|nr:lipopolysaccharide transport periplasmic protein LptA [Thermodesulfobacteriota bacterium]